MNVKTHDTEPPVSGEGGARRDEPELPPPSAEDLEQEAPREELAPATGEETEAARLLKDRWLRAEAELQNFRRRAQRDVEETRRAAEERALLTTIDYLDDLERALLAAREAGAPESWTQGVQLVAQRMRDYLARHGVTEIAAEGASFDPRLHEALMETPAPAGVEPGHVVQVARKGYQIQERALRAARVIVARKADDH